MKIDLMTVKRLSAFIIYMLLVMMMLLSLGGCRLTKPQRKANKLIKKVERFKAKHPDAYNLVSVDTIIVPIRTEVKVKEFDTVEIDKVIQTFVTDTVLITDIRYKVLQSISNDTLYLDSVFIHARAWNDQNGLNGFIYSDSIPIKTEVLEVTKTVNTGVGKAWRTIALVLIVIFVVYIFITQFLPKILKTWP